MPIVLSFGILELPISCWNDPKMTACQDEGTLDVPIRSHGRRMAMIAHELHPFTTNHKMFTNQERETLIRFLQQLTAAPAPQKVAEADTLIQEAIAKQPDAHYLLVQRAILLEQALNGAKAQIAQLQSQLESARAGSNGSFLGGNPWGQRSELTSSQGEVPGARQYQIPKSNSPWPVGQATSGGSSFLGNLATTAAGVVAGSFLFQGIEHLLGHHPSGWLSGGEPARAQVAEETIINNYYDNSPASDGNQADEDHSFLANDDGDVFQDDSDDSDWV